MTACAAVTLGAKGFKGKPQPAQNNDKCRMTNGDAVPPIRHLACVIIYRNLVAPSVLT
jgi:hypothetical protein